MEKNLNEWKSKFSRECGYKNSIILSGNIDDLIQDNDNRKYIEITENIISLLKEKGYRNIIKWDRVDGVDYNISNVSFDTNDFEKSDNVYRIDDEDEEPIQSAYDNIEDFFGLILEKINSGSTKNAFILDYSDFIFGSSNTLSEQERDWLATLKKGINNVNSYNMLEVNREVENIVIIITKKLSNIPVDYYVNSSLVSTINIPYPGRSERAAFIQDNGVLLKITNNVWDPLVFDDLVDSLEGFSLKDITQLMKLSMQEDAPLNSEKIINLYKYGERTSPWEELSRDKLSNIEVILGERVKGQDQALQKIREVLIRAYTGFSGIQHSVKQKKPKGALFFVGPTGVGKTELAKSLASFLFGDEDACIRFDMSEFNHEHSDQRFVGAPPGYVGFEEGGQLTNKVKENPFCVLLFDEIEKAHGKILDKFLQILEDGRLTDGKGETVSFAETIIIFTSNIGAAEVEYNSDEKLIAKKFKAKVEEHFIKSLGRPELLNRIGKSNIVPFNFIKNENVLAQIAKSKFSGIKKFVKERYKVDVIFDNEELSLKLLTEKCNPQNGGRGLINDIESSIINDLSEWIFINYDMLNPNRTIVILNSNPRFPVFDFELR